MKNHDLAIIQSYLAHVLWLECMDTCIVNAVNVLSVMSNVALSHY